MKPVRTSIASAAIAVLAALLISGCSNDKNPAAPATSAAQMNADDLAIQAAAALETGAGVDIAASEASSGGSGSPAPRIFPDGISPARGVAAAAETTFTIGAVTYTVTSAFYDSGDNELPGYGPTATRLHVTSRATGSVQTLRYQASIGHEGVLDVTGIEAAADTLGFDGASADTAQAQFTSLDMTRSRYFRWISALTLANIRALKDRATNPWPLTGTATFVVDAVRYRTNAYVDVEESLSGTVVVTFNGTSQPEVTVNGTYHYHLDLVTGIVTRA